LDTLCDWLDLPRIVVLDASRWADCELPERPDQIDGVLLDRVNSPAEVFRLQTCLEALWDVPVLGALEQRASLEATISRLPRGSSPPRELCHLLGDQLARFARPERIRALASRREFMPVRPGLFAPPAESLARGDRRPLTVAVAFDSAFNCYFPDTLDLLELRGAKVVDFSPLRDEVLPEADVVYLGCGHPEFEAEALSSNHCMLLALRNHVRGGRRVYAEGGGLAYLCEHLETPKGELVPMLGVLPAVARLNRHRVPVRPVEVTIAKDNWLGRAGARLRGYLNSNWSLEATGPLAECLAEPGQEQDLLGQFQVVGSRMHLNFAAQPEALGSFFKPACSKPALAGSRA
jgi:cobyrinic acid a,c-diamide synthase